MSIIAIVLLVLVFLPIAILGIKTWHWLHVTAAVFLFGSTLWFTISAASVAELHLDFGARIRRIPYPDSLQSTHDLDLFEKNLA